MTKIITSIYIVQICFVKKLVRQPWMLGKDFRKKDKANSIAKNDQADLTNQYVILKNRQTDRNAMWWNIMRLDDMTGDKTNWCMTMVTFCSQVFFELKLLKSLIAFRIVL